MDEELEDEDGLNNVEAGRDNEAEEEENEVGEVMDDPEDKGAGERMEDEDDD